MSPSWESYGVLSTVLPPRLLPSFASFLEFILLRLKQLKQDNPGKQIDHHGLLVRHRRSGYSVRSWVFNEAQEVRHDKLSAITNSLFRETFQPYFKQWLQDQLRNLRQEQGSKPGFLANLLDNFASKVFSKFAPHVFIDYGFIWVAKCGFGAKVDDNYENVLTFIGVFNSWYPCQILTTKQASLFD